MRVLNIEAGPQEGQFILSNYINEHLDLTPLSESSSSHLILNLRQVIDINSMGIKKWIDGIQELQEKGKTLEYVECPEVFVECCNTTPDFTDGVKIQSFSVTFMCEECDKYEPKMLQLSELDLENLPPEFPCPECHETMVPEEEDAFEFLEDF